MPTPTPIPMPTPIPVPTTPYLTDYLYPFYPA